MTFPKTLNKSSLTCNDQVLPTTVVAQLDACSEGGRLWVQNLTGSDQRLEVGRDCFFANHSKLQNYSYDSF